MKVAFTPDGWTDYQHWIENDPKMLKKMSRLIDDIRRSPYKGIGQVEPLKENWRGWWSRRITEEHRLVYRITGSGADQQVEIAKCRFHY